MGWAMLLWQCLRWELRKPWGGWNQRGAEHYKATNRKEVALSVLVVAVLFTIAPCFPGVRNQENTNRKQVHSVGVGWLWVALAGTDCENKQMKIKGSASPRTL